MDATDDSSGFVPDGFDVPQGLDHAAFRLRPLDVEYNRRDYAAWSTSIDHIRATPGFSSESWPREMSLEANRGDLAKHAHDFAARRGFTYTVLDAVDDVVGCVYIYPSRDDRHDVRVRSWVCARCAALDGALYRAVVEWLANAWPFERIDYPSRLDAPLAQPSVPLA